MATNTRVSWRLFLGKMSMSATGALHLPNVSRGGKADLLSGGPARLLTRWEDRMTATMIRLRCFDLKALAAFNRVTSRA